MKTITYFRGQGRESDRCRDMVYYRENGEFGFYSLADGLNSKAKSHIGALAVQKALADEWEKEPERFFQESNIQTKMNAIEIIHQVLYNLSGGKDSSYEYASTLLILLVSEKQKMYKWLHIGDGIIAKETVHGEIKIISHAQNGITKQFTYTTADRRLTRYLHIGDGRLKDIRKLMLFTDGVLHSFYCERKLSQEGEQLLKEGPRVLHAVIKKQHPRDDYSMVEIQI